jgi:hypothetical protein
MPLDDRLRVGLTRDKAYRPPGELDVLSDVVSRAGHRRRVRGLAIGAAAAVVLVLVAVAVPWALRTVRSDEPVVERPTSASTTRVIDDWRPPARATPIDGGGWRTGSLDAPDRLAALEGTGLEHLGPKVARKAAMDQAFSEAEFLQGGFTGILQSHNLGTIEVLPSGTFEVAGKQVVITFDSGGEAVFGWSKRDGDTLVLTFVSTTAPSMYGAPAEVFLRMWAAAPFVLQ